MSRRSTPLAPRSRDGTSQRSRRLAALDPSHAPIDERTSADLLRFVQAYADKLQYLEAGDDGEVGPTGTWHAFAHDPRTAVADMIATKTTPERLRC